MNMIHRQHLLTRISDLDRNILTLGIYVDEAMRNAIKVLKDNDLEGAERVILEDDKINSMETSIQDDIILLIATEQPVAGDLRHIITSFKIIAQLERMGDHAVHIAKEVLKMGKTEYVKPLIDIPRMAEIGLAMLKKSLDAFAASDAQLALETAKMDDSVDNLRDQVNRELFTYMMENSSNFKQINSLMFVNRWLERFADHVTNICEWIIYDANGEHLELNL
ncbi:MAG: phosphate signaling complex protein PhoU [Spirochaetia bacterium]|nr:phosphate signaling complex protein PhoU [Spirochaetia bacterium]